MSMEQAERDYLKPPECGEPCGYCDICGDPIYLDDVYYKIDDMRYCEKCINSSKKTASGEI